MEIILTKHAKARAKQRGIDPLRLRKQLNAIDFDPSTPLVEWDIPNTKLFVAFSDIIKEGKEIRNVVTISFRHIGADEKRLIKEKNDRTNNLIFQQTKEFHNKNRYPTGKNKNRSSKR